MVQTHIARISKYDVERGYGFLIEADGNRHFFHITSCNGFIPRPDMMVTFEIGVGRKGPAAVNIALIQAVS